jgi:hypothetical protein
MPFPYKKALVIGATSGIGLALSEKIIANGSHVIAVGRRKARLDSLMQEHGADKLSINQFDITNLEGIPSFVHSYITTIPILTPLHRLTSRQYSQQPSRSRFRHSKCRHPATPRFLIPGNNRPIPHLGRVNNKLHILHPHPQISPSALSLQISQPQVHHLYLQRSRSRSYTKSSRILRQQSSITPSGFVC